MSSVSYDGGFLTKAKGDDDKLVLVKFNNGTTKPMKRARKRCLDDADKLQKSIRRPPSEEEWAKRSHLFSLGTVEDLFGSYPAMLDELQKRKQPPPGRPAQVKITEMAKERRVIFGQETAKEETRPKPPQKATMETEVYEMTKKTRQAYSDKELAELLYEACDGRPYISVGQYQQWSTSQSKKVPVSMTVANRFGNGLWSEKIFDRMREILGLEGPAPDAMPCCQKEAEPEVTIEPALATTPGGDPVIPCCRLVSTLNREFKLGDIYFRVSEDDGFAVVIGMSYYNGIDKKQLNETGESQVDCYKTIYSLKMTSGKDPEHLVDFPEFAPDTLYLIDGGLYEMLSPKQRRPDLIPVWYSRDSQQKLGLYVE